jgi:hypothetical protein
VGTDATNAVTVTAATGSSACLSCEDQARTLDGTAEFLGALGEVSGDGGGQGLGLERPCGHAQLVIFLGDAAMPSPRRQSFAGIPDKPRLE